MRTTVELVREINETAATGIYKTVVLVIGFEDHSKVIAAGDPKALSTLNAMITQGGTPVGIVAVESVGTGLKVKHRPLEEVKQEQWASDLLTAFCHSFIAQIEAAGLAETHSN